MMNGNTEGDHPRRKGLRPYGVETDEAQDKEGSITQDTTGLSLSQALRTLTFWIFGTHIGNLRYGYDRSSDEPGKHTG
jgi:hypothetical protein